MITSAQLIFIVIDKQEDLPTKLEMLDRLHCKTKLEEFIMPNGDIIVACKDIKLNAPDMPVNLKATDMYRQQTTGFGESYSWTLLFNQKERQILICIN